MLVPEGTLGFVCLCVFTNTNLRSCSVKKSQDIPALSWGPSSHKEYTSWRSGLIGTGSGPLHQPTPGELRSSLLKVMRQGLLKGLQRPPTTSPLALAANLSQCDVDVDVSMFPERVYSFQQILTN